MRQPTTDELLQILAMLRERARNPYLSPDANAYVFEVAAALLAKAMDIPDDDPPLETETR